MLRLTMRANLNTDAGIPAPLFPHLVTKTEAVHPRVAYAYVKVYYLFAVF